MRVVIPALSLVCGLTAAAAASPETVSVRLGRFIAVVDPAATTLTPTAFGFVVRGPRSDQVATVFVEEVADAPCSPQTLELQASPRLNRRTPHTRTTASGLRVHSLGGDTGCRNATGGPVTACLRVDGVTTTFNAPGAGCRTPRGHEALVLGVIHSLRLAEASDFAPRSEPSAIDTP